VQNLENLRKSRLYPSVYPHRHYKLHILRQCTNIVYISCRDYDVHRGTVYSVQNLENIAFVPVFKAHRHTFYILRHCTTIVYISCRDYDVHRETDPTMIFYSGD
jgi:hypothetical protein